MAVLSDEHTVALQKAFHCVGGRLLIRSKCPQDAEQQRELVARAADAVTSATAVVAEAYCEAVDKLIARGCEPAEAADQAARRLRETLVAFMTGDGT